LVRPRAQKVPGAIGEASLVDHTRVNWPTIDQIPGGVIKSPTWLGPFGVEQVLAPPQHTPGKKRLDENECMNATDDKDYNLLQREDKPFFGRR